MTLNDIIRRAYKYKGLSLDCYDNKKINNNLIELLKLCVNNNININLSEQDVVKIINIYYSINNKYYDKFIKNIIKLSKKEINIKKVYELL